MTHVALGILTAAGLITAPAPSSPPEWAERPCSPHITTVGMETRIASPPPAWNRLVAACRRPAPGRVARLAARMGASLAWDIADLPSHNAPLPDPVGRLSSSDGFPGGAWTWTAVEEPGGAIALLLDRWNRLYPPYAIQSWDQR